MDGAGLNIFFSVYNIINIQIDEFNECLEQYKDGIPLGSLLGPPDPNNTQIIQDPETGGRKAKITEVQAAQARNIRRLGKNMKAAQDCGKRANDRILQLKEDVERERERKEKLRQESAQLSQELQHWEEKNRQLDHLIMRHFNCPTDRFTLVEDPTTGKLAFKRILEEINQGPQPDLRQIPCQDPPPLLQLGNSRPGVTLQPVASFENYERMPVASPSLCDLVPDACGLVYSVNSVLPPEMLAEVFSYLAPKDLKTVMLVCKTWNKAAESRPALWSWAKLRHLYQFTLNRLRGAREMAILEPPSDSWHTLSEAALQHPGLKKVTLATRNFDVSVLAKMATQVEELDITNIHLNEDQKKAIFEAIVAGPGNLKKLSVTSVGTIDVDLLASAVNNLECFESIDLSVYQMEKILTKALEATSLKELDICGYGAPPATLIAEAEKVIPFISLDTDVRY